MSKLLTSLAILLAFSPCASFAQELVDLTDSFSITNESRRYSVDRRRRQITKPVDVTILNTSGAPISGPLRVEIDVSNPRVQVVGSEGSAGNYFYSFGGVAAGESIEIKPITFVQGLRDRFTYSIKVFGVPVANQPPVADAGNDIVLQLEQGQDSAQVSLNGSLSSDADGEVVSYVWTGTPDPEDVVSPSLTLGVGTYSFQLVVTDDKGASSAPDAVQVQILEADNVPPVANAGADISLQLEQGQDSAQVSLNGSLSSDADGEVVSYVWTGTPDPEDVVLPSLTLGVGTYSFQLVVTDDKGAGSAPDTVQVQILEADNIPPVANAGADISLQLEQGQDSAQVLLNGSLSSDADGEVVSYVWSGTPDPEDVVLPSLTLGVGTYSFQLVVTDDKGTGSAPDTVQVQILEANNTPPVANAGADISLQLEQGQDSAQVSLNGSLSSDADGEVASYMWTGTPDPEDVVLPSLTLGVGTYSFQLVVTDDKGAGSAPDTVQVQILEADNIPPVANAGDDFSLELQEGETTVSVSLDGTLSSDIDGEVVSYQWAGSPDPDDVSSPSVELSEGNYSFSLIVVDDDGALSESDTVQVSVLPFIADNNAPVASAGQDRELTIFAGETTVRVLLDGSASFDGDGTVVSYSWTGGPLASNEVSPVIDLLEGSYTFNLVVTDDDGASSPVDSVEVVVSSIGPRSVPVIDAPDTLTLIELESGGFQVSASDPDGEKVSLTSFPKINNATFTSQNGESATGDFNFSPDIEQSGKYAVTFVATDELGLSATKTVRIDVSDANRAPVLNPLPAFSVNEGEVLSFAVTAVDPDADALGVSASDVPENAIFIEGSRTLVFAPDFDQAGSYQVTFGASDGELDSNEVVASVNVVDVQGGTGGGELVLNLNEVESPTLSKTARISGGVNAAAPTLEDTKVVDSLITGLFPATGRQGETITVDLEGDTGDFSPSFIDGLSEVDFGADIEVVSFTIVDADSAQAEISVSSSAELGSRAVSVETDDEVTVSVVGFNVTPGVTTVTGVLIDPSSGEPIANALVSVQGTGATGFTDAEGKFSITGAPPGLQNLVVNPVNSDALLIPIQVQGNAIVDVGILESQTLVYDPGAPPSASLPSVLGRGLAVTDGSLGFEAAKQLVIDTFIAVGGSEAGVIDEYGNQLNPAVEGAGLVSLSPELVDYVAELSIRGEDYQLQEILFAFAFLFEWAAESPPTLLQMLQDFQGAVDRAWLDPRAPENQIVIAIFNPGRGLSPDAPVLTPETSLSPIQRQLLANSFFAFVEQIRQANPQVEGNIIAKLSSFLVSNAYADININVPLAQDVFTQYYANTLSGFPSGALRSGVSATASASFEVGAQAITGTISKSSVAGTAGGGVGGFIFGQVASVFTNFFTAKIIKTLQPQGPLPLGAFPQRVEFEDGSVRNLVVVEFSRDPLDKALGNLDNVKYAYRLWKWKTIGGKLDLIGGGSPNNDAFSAGEPQNSGVVINASNISRLAITDFNPSVGYNAYKLDAIRTVGNAGLADGQNNIASGLPWWTGIVPTFGLSIGGGSFNPAGTLVAFLEPAAQILNALKFMVSPLSDNVVAFVSDAEGAGDPALGFQVDPNRPVAYESIPSENNIYKINTITFAKTLFRSASFAAPHQSGLAIDSAGDLYSENSATDEKFGGKIFKYLGDFSASPGARIHAGQSNYYSFMLGFAKPTAVPAMTMHPDGELLIADGVEGRVKKVPVLFTYDAYRRVGQPWATSDLFSFSPGMDMTTSPDGNIYIAQPGTRNILKIDSVTREVSKVFSDETPFLSSPRGVTVDNNGLLVISDSSGTIYAVPPIYQDRTENALTDCQVSRITLGRGLTNPTYVRVRPSASQVFYREAGKTKSIFFGLTGQVFDSSGSSVSGAQVKVIVGSGEFPAVVRTDDCGVFVAPGLLAGRSGSISATVQIKHPEFGTQVLRTTLNPKSQTYRDFTLRDVTPPPPPPTTEPTVEEPEIDITDEPTEVQVTVVPGKVMVAPEIECDLIEVTLPPAPAPVVPPQVPVTVQEPVLEFISPVDGMELGPNNSGDGVELELAFGSNVTDLDAVIGENATNAVEKLGARAFVGGESVFFSEVDPISTPETNALYAHEISHSSNETREFTSNTQLEEGAAKQIERMVTTTLTDSAGKPVLTKSTKVLVNLVGEGGQVKVAMPTTGAVVGKVMEPDTGQPVGGIVVEVEGTDTNATTDQDGVYNIPRVDPGTKKLTVKLGCKND